MEEIESGLRSIRLVEQPRPTSLQLDKLFAGATKCVVHDTPATSDSTASSSSSPLNSTTSRRSDSPDNGLSVYPLPLPQPLDLSNGNQSSPLGGLFDYPELIPLIVDEFEYPHEFATLARVSKSFYAMAIKRLYKHIWIRPWEDGCHFKFLMFFQTLDSNPELCKLVKKLDVRFFPFSGSEEGRIILEKQIQKAFENFFNLEYLVWTRDRSINPELLEIITNLPHLQHLEISGHANWYYDPKCIGNMSTLFDLRIMMPDSIWSENLLEVVKKLAERPCGGLRGLALVCRSSPLIDDKLLKELSPHLTDLRRFTLWGSTRVTRDSIYAILREAEAIEELSIDILLNTDMLDLSRAPGLNALRTLSLAIVAPSRSFLSLEDLPTLPPLPQLQNLHLTLSGATKHLPQGGLLKLQEKINFSNLRKLSLNNLIVGSTALDNIINTSSKLQELYLTLDSKMTIINSEHLDELGGTLRILHITTPEKFRPTKEDLCLLAFKLPLLEQIGSGNRVLEVSRRYVKDEYNFEKGEKGKEEIVIFLSRWKRTYTPGYFQIWRG